MAIYVEGISLQVYHLWLFVTIPFTRLQTCALNLSQTCQLTLFSPFSPYWWTFSVLWLLNPENFFVLLFGCQKCCAVDGKNHNLTQISLSTVFWMWHLLRPPSLKCLCRIFASSLLTSWPASSIWQIFTSTHTISALPYNVFPSPSTTVLYHSENNL